MSFEYNPTVKVSRDGKALGEFKLMDIQGAVARRAVLSTDHYWMSGMSEWKHVSELIPRIAGLRAAAAAMAANGADMDEILGGPPLIATTTHTIEGYRIVRYLGMVRGIMVRSPNVIESINGWGDGLLGGKQNTFTGMCEKTRSEAYDILVKNAKAMGANAVVGIAYDATDVMGRCTEVLCYGTAVIVEAFPQARSS